MKREVLRLQRITKIEDGITVLDNFNLHIFAGEVMGLVFVDAQGKKDLVDLLCENLPIHYGRVYFREALVNSYQYSSLSQNAVTLIEKESPLIGGMTVADNVFVLRKGFKKYIIHPQVLNAQFASLARRAGVVLEGSALVQSLSAYEKCVVQLLKAVVLGHRLVIIQDISNTISAADLKKFHDIMRYFASEGMSFLYICAHHEEAFTICDRAAVVGNGQVLRCIPRADFSDKFFRQYVLDPGYFGKPDIPETEGGILRFDAVYTPELHGVSFSLAKGECVLMLDVNNTALGDIFDLLARKKAPVLGDIFVEGKPFKMHQKRPRVGLIQELPLKSMIYPDFSYLENLCFLAGEKQPSLWLGNRIQKSVRQEYLPFIGPDIDAANVKDLPATSLYNLVYYSQHLFNPRLVVIMQPFFEADMYLRRHILALINAIRSRGIAVLMLAVNISDGPVVADRMLVIEKGKIVASPGREEREEPNRGKNV